MRIHDLKPSFAHAFALALMALFAAGSWSGVVAQEMGNLPQVPSTPSLRPYWHVFAAYTIAIVLIGGWAVSIGRRLRDVEGRLNDRAE